MNARTALPGGSRIFLIVGSIGRSVAITEGSPESGQLEIRALRRRLKVGEAVPVPGCRGSQCR